MLEKLANIFRIPDLRNRVLFTLALLAVYRLGGHIPTPGVNADMLQQFFANNRGSVLGFVDLFSGGQLRRLTIFALGIMPYITASIILQLLTVVYEPLAKLQKEGELGRKKITQWTRYLTVLLSAMQSFGIAMTLAEPAGHGSAPRTGLRAMTMLTLTTGSAFIMWLGEQITERGVGNGMSLLIFAGIVVGLPRGVADLVDKIKNSYWGPFTVPAILMLVIVMFLVVAFIVYVERSERRISVQYAKRIVGRKMMGGSSTFLPLRVNSGGVMPVIFASSILTLPQTLGILPVFGKYHWVKNLTDSVEVGRTAVHPAVRGGHHLLRLLLRVDRVQPERCSRQHAQVWRIHSGYPAGRAHVELHQRDSYPHHAGGRVVPDHHQLHSGVDDGRLASQPPAGMAGRRPVR